MKVTTGSAISFLTVVFAIIFSLIYLWAAWQLYQAFGSVKPGDDKLWDHASSIFSGIQSAGLSAIGVLLGVAVQQPRVADAQAQTSKAKDAIQQVLTANRSANEKGGAGVSPEASTTLNDEMHDALMKGLRA